MDKKILFVVYQAPVGAIWVNEAFRTAFGMYGEDIEPAVLLMDAATITLSATTAPENLGLLPVKIVQKFLKRYETPVYAVEEDAQRFQVGNIDEGYTAQMIAKASLPEFFHSFDNVIFM
jgi:tRNA 2-thiouridine synthesizing protein C